MDINTLFNDAIEQWRINKGIGTALIPPPIVDKYMILGVLQRLFSKNSNCSVLIIVNNFNERNVFIEFLTHQDDETNNAEFKRLISEKYIKIFTNKLIDNDNFHINVMCTIVYHCECLSKNMFSILNNSKFRLVVNSKLMKDNSSNNKLYSICPLLSCFKQNELDEVRTNTPVEEMQIGIAIPEDSKDYKLLNYYNEYITTSLNIFGSFNIMEQARTGNAGLHLSANQICYSIAQDNGWNDHLDMSIELNVQIDELYNPNNIHERAVQTYEIIRNRSKLLSSNDTKLQEIYNIVDKHKDDKILIINKHAEFAAKVTEYINNLSDEDICGDYHDKMEPKPAIDVYGNPKFYKSGVHRGERMLMHAQAQRSLNETRFNLGNINVLSTGNSPDKNLNIPVDVIIITSPLCEDIKTYIYRLSNVQFINNSIKLYTIYVKNSIEENKLQQKEKLSNHIIVKNCENEVKLNDNCDFVVVD